MKWLVLHMTILIVLFAAQATHQDTILISLDAPTRKIDIDLFTHDATIHMLSDLDNNFSQVSKQFLRRFREQSFIYHDHECPSSSSSWPSIIDLPMLKDQVLGAAESLIGDKLSAVWNTVDTKSLLHRQIQRTTRHVCPDLTHHCLVENEDTVKQQLDVYIHQHIISNVNHLLDDSIPQLYELAQSQATQVLSQFFHQCLRFQVKTTQQQQPSSSSSYHQHHSNDLHDNNNNTIYRHLTITTNSIPFVFHHHT
ncbi:hypothetical protein BDA99DRAFT_503205 [Phascolomyces articulosus]|uniref:Uncharacterized protein n=1 Tax=Phascolomyces articulosus TaxID=60185 RepID=A0AAD5PGB7_9FUNG|nr:hypothetical protein BDA99DRAFT_503205 [Phascolomyces articulosus]